MKKHELTISKLAGIVALLFMMFPWVSFRLLHMDTQPWYIIFGVFFILLCARKKLPPVVIAVYLLPFVALLVGCYYYESFGRLSLRAVFSYLGLAVSIHVYFLYRKCYAINMLRIIKFVNYLWLCAGVVQVLLGKYVLGFLVAARTTHDRGVTSLAPEPTYFAVVLVFLSWLIWIESGYRLSHRSKVLLAVNAFAVIALAKSAMGVVFILLFLSVYLATYMLSKRALYVMIFLLPLLFVSSSKYSVVDEESRVAMLYEKTKKEPLHIIEADASINSRVAHIALPIYGIVSDFGIPHGYDSYIDHAESLVNYFNGFFWYGYGGDKIMSALASSAYELGWFSIGFVLLILFMLRNTLNLRVAFVNTVVMFAFLMAAIPIAFPFTGMVLAASYFNYRNKRVKMYADVYSKPHRIAMMS